MLRLLHVFGTILLFQVPESASRISLYNTETEIQIHCKNLCVALVQCFALFPVLEEREQKEKNRFYRCNIFHFLDFSDNEHEHPAHTSTSVPLVGFLNVKEPGRDLLG